VNKLSDKVDSNCWRSCNDRVFQVLIFAKKFHCGMCVVMAFQGKKRAISKKSKYLMLRNQKTKTNVPLFGTDVNGNWKFEIFVSIENFDTIQ
jgi:hypothetical protein